MLTCPQSRLDETSLRGYGSLHRVKRSPVNAATAFAYAFHHQSLYLAPRAG